MSRDPDAAPLALIQDAVRRVEERQEWGRSTSAIEQVQKDILAAIGHDEPPRAGHLANDDLQLAYDEGAALLGPVVAQILADIDRAFVQGCEAGNGVWREAPAGFAAAIEGIRSSAPEDAGAHYAAVTAACPYAEDPLRLWWMQGFGRAVGAAQATEWRDIAQRREAARVALEEDRDRMILELAEALGEEGADVVTWEGLIGTARAKRERLDGILRDMEEMRDREP